MLGRGPSLLLIEPRPLGGVSGSSSSLDLRFRAHAGFVNLDSGTSSSFFAGVFDGYLTGDLGLLVPLDFDGVFGGLGFWEPEATGCWSLDEDSFSEYLTFVISSSVGSTSPSLKDSGAEVTLLSCSFSDLLSLAANLSFRFLI